MRDLPLQSTLKEPNDGWVELSAGEELEARAEGAVVDDLFTGLN
jgi:hypothetical protein